MPLSVVFKNKFVAKANKVFVGINFETLCFISLHVAFVCVIISTLSDNEYFLKEFKVKTTAGLNPLTPRSD